MNEAIRDAAGAVRQAARGFLPSRWWQLSCWLLGYMLLAAVAGVGAFIVVQGLLFYVPVMLGHGAASNNALTRAYLESTVSGNLWIAGLGLAALVLLRIAGRGRSVGAVIAPRRPGTVTSRAAQFVLWVSVCLVGMCAIGEAEGWVSDAIGTTIGHSSAGGAWRAASGGVTAAAGIQAGVLEEISYVAVPLGLVIYFGARLGWTWHGFTSWSTSPRAMRWALLAGVLSALVARVIIHAYQGPINAVMVACWALVNVLVFLESRTVVPLILAHFLYDAVAIRGDLTGIETLGWLGIACAVAIASIVVLLVGRRRAVRSRRPVAVS